VLDVLVSEPGLQRSGVVTSFETTEAGHHVMVDAPQRLVDILL